MIENVTTDPAFLRSGLAAGRDKICGFAWRGKVCGQQGWMGRGTWCRFSRLVGSVTTRGSYSRVATIIGPILPRGWLSQKEHSQGHQHSRQGKCY